MANVPGGAKNFIKEVVKEVAEAAKDPKKVAQAILGGTAGAGIGLTAQAALNKGKQQNDKRS
jgi:hypothetical protein